MDGVCNRICTQECLEPLLCDTAGGAHCNPCILAGALCQGGFQETGPVEGATCSFGGGDGELDCSGEVSVFDAPRCCTEKGVGCKTEGAACSSGALIPAVPCAKGLVCVITNLGNLAVDLADEGTCEAAGDGPAPDCSLDFCDAPKGGDGARCTLRGRTVTCAAFAAGETDTGGPGPPGGGPLPPPPPPKTDCDAPDLADQNALVRGKCCREEQKGCAVAEESCCGGGNCGIIPPVPCAPGLVCLAKPPQGGSPSFGKCGYNCKTKEVWTPAKSEWCCRKEGAGCPAPTPKPYNCYTKEVWPADKVAWCCANEKVGCPTPTTTPDKYNCLTEEVWPADKAAWCCANKKLGCPADGPTPTLPADRCSGFKYGLCRRDSDCPGKEVCVELRRNKPAACELRAVSGNFYCTAIGCAEGGGGGSGGYGGYGGYYRRGGYGRMGHCSPKLG